MTLVLARLWIVASTLLILAGWGLSLLGVLGIPGYTIALMVIGGAVWTCARAAGWRIEWKPLTKWRFRRKHWLPAAFAVVTLLIVIGGILHPPNNFDSLAYRVPRTLHWLAEGRWHWIDTTYVRLNTRSFGTEWTIAPILALTRSDRSIWVINLAMFLLLPGLIFSCFRGLGVSGRTSWHWMWLIPCADGLILQAAGGANDLPATFFAIAGVALAISARRRNSAVDAWLSVLSAALLTGLKPTNAPFGLVWLAVAWPTFKLLLSRPIATALVVAASITVSFVPSAIVNHLHCGDWTGATVELPETKLPRPAALVPAFNSVVLVTENLMPSVFPWSERWTSFWSSQVPAWFLSEMTRVYGIHSRFANAPQMPTEELSGFGFALSWLALVSSITLFRERSARQRSLADKMIVLSPWIGLLVIVVFMPATGIARYALAYYPFLLLPILIGARGENLTRKKWWRWGARLALVNAALVLVISPVRPLWPAVTVCNYFAHLPNAPALVIRARDVYQVYSERWDALREVRAVLPENAKTIALFSYNDIEASLWRPFGSRKFCHVTIGKPAQYMKAKGFPYLLVNETLAEGWAPGWLDGLEMERVDTVFVKQLASRPPFKWTLFRRHSSATDQLPEQTHEQQ